MTKERLNQYLGLAKEVEELKLRIEILEARCEGVSLVISNMPRGGVKGDNYSKLGDAVRKLVDLERCLYEEMMDVEEYIQDIPDATTRLIFRYKHIHGMTFEQIARKVQYCVAQCKRKYYRYYNGLPNK